MVGQYVKILQNFKKAIILKGLAHLSNYFTKILINKKTFKFSWNSKD